MAPTVDSGFSSECRRRLPLTAGKSHPSVFSDATGCQLATSIHQFSTAPVNRRQRRAENITYERTSSQCRRPRTKVMFNATGPSRSLFRINYIFKTKCRSCTVYVALVIISRRRQHAAPAFNVNQNRIFFEQIISLKGAHCILSSSSVAATYIFIVVSKSNTR